VGCITITATIATPHRDGQRFAGHDLLQRALLRDRSAALAAPREKLSKLQMERGWRTGANTCRRTLAYTAVEHTNKQTGLHGTRPTTLGAIHMPDHMRARLSAAIHIYIHCQLVPVTRRW
jgi:hypothetical protein